MTWRARHARVGGTPDRPPRNRALALRVLLAAALVLGTLPASMAEEAPPAPDVDSTLDNLLQLDPAALAASLNALREQAGAQSAEAGELKASAEALEAQAEALEARLAALRLQTEALFAAFGIGGDAAMGGMAAAAMAPEAGAEVVEAVMDFTNYDDHIRPIFQNRCMRCHNDDQQRGGLSLSTHGALMQGGSSGAVVSPGDPDGSRLLRLIMHTEEPVMPPSGDPLGQEEQDLIRKWIQEGGLANAASTPIAQEQTGPEEDRPAFVAATFSDTPPMPEAALPAAEGLSGRGVAARAVAASPRAPMLAVGGYKQVLLFDLDSHALLGALPFPEGEIFTLSFSLNGEVLVAGGGEGGHSGVCVTWNIRTGERTGTFGGYFDVVLAADISPDHRMVAVGGTNERVRVYATDTGQELYRIDPHTDWIYAVKFTPDGEVLVTADRSGGMFLWQAANGRQVEQLRGHEGAIHALAYTADSLHLASAGADGTVQIWDTWEYRRVRSFNAHGAAVHAVDFSEDGRLTTTGADRATKVFNLEGQEQHQFEGLEDWGYAAAFSHDGLKIIAGGWNGEVLVWDTASQEALATLKTNPVFDPFQFAAAP